MTDDELLRLRTPTSAVEPIAQGKGASWLNDFQLEALRLAANELDADYPGMAHKLRSIALTARSSPVEGWQPIESAPKDACILVGGGTYTHSSGEYPEWPLTTVAQVTWCQTLSSWVHNAEHDYYTYKPTHWRHLPPAPANDRGNQS